MPTYNYICDDCEYTQEEFHSMFEDPIFECPCCGKQLKKGIGGGTGFILSGWGWTTKNNDAPTPGKVGREVGVRVDHDLKKQMEEAGEA